MEREWQWHCDERDMTCDMVDLNNDDDYDDNADNDDDNDDDGYRLNSANVMMTWQHKLWQ